MKWKFKCLYSMVVISIIILISSNSYAFNGVGENVFSSDHGSFVDLENITEEVFSDAVFSEIKIKLMDLGLSEYWALQSIKKITTVEDDNIGKAIANQLPGGFLYGDTVADIINTALKNDKLVEVDLFNDSIQPKNKIEDFKVTFEIPMTKVTSFSGNLLLILKHDIASGPRDQVNFTISYTTINGKKVDVKSEEILNYDKNGENVYEVVLRNVDSSRMKNIQLTYENDFNLPKQVSTILAETIQTGVNKSANELSFGTVNPIDENYKNDIDDLFAEIGVNEFLGNGDYASVLTEQIISRLPYIGKAISLVPGLSDKINDTIRESIDFDEVISKASIENIQLFVNELSEKDYPFDQFIIVDENIPLENDWIFYTRDKELLPEILTGNFNRNVRESALFLSDRYPKTGPKGILKRSYVEDFTYTANVYIGNVSPDIDSFDQAGLIFRVKEPEKITSALVGESLKGYFAGISAQGNYAFIGKFNEDKSFSILSKTVMNIENRTWYNLKVVAKDENIELYVDDMTTPVLSVTDDLYFGGYVGIRHYSEDAAKNTLWKDLFLSQNTDDNNQMVNFELATSLHQSGKTTKVDLDGDGSLEEVKYENASIYINGSPIKDFLASVNHEFRITDINPQDKYKEIIVDTSQSKTTPNYYLYTFDSQEPWRLINVGGGYQDIISIGNGQIEVLKNGKKIIVILSEDHYLEELTESNNSVEPLDPDFSTASTWAIEELTQANALGLITPRVQDNLKENITRAEFASLVVNLYEVMTEATAKPASENTFTDTKDVDVLKAYNLGIIGGRGNGIADPDSFVTRQEMAVMYYKALKTIYEYYFENMSDTDGVLTIADKSDVASWAIKYVDFVFDMEIIVGSNNRFRPLDNASKEQAIIVVKRVYENNTNRFNKGYRFIKTKGEYSSDTEETSVHGASDEYLYQEYVTNIDELILEPRTNLFGVDLGASPIAVPSSRTYFEGIYEVKLHFDDLSKSGDAGLLIDTQQINYGGNYIGYYVGISPKDATIKFGKNDNGFTPYKTFTYNEDIANGAKLSVEVKNSKAKIHLNDTFIGEHPITKLGTDKLKFSGMAVISNNIKTSIKYIRYEQLE